MADIITDASDETTWASYSHCVALQEGASRLCEQFSNARGSQSSRPHSVPKEEGRVSVMSNIRPLSEDGVRPNEESRTCAADLNSNSRGPPQPVEELPISHDDERNVENARARDTVQVQGKRTRLPLISRTKSLNSKDRENLTKDASPRKGNTDDESQ